MKKRPAVESEDEPSPMNYNNVVSAGKNKENVGSQKKFTSQGTADFNYESRFSERERSKIHPEQVSKRKLEDELFNEPRERVLGKENNKQNLNANSGNNTNSNIQNKASNNRPSNGPSKIQKNISNSDDVDEAGFDSNDEGLLDSQELVDLDNYEDESPEIQNAPNPTVSLIKKQSMNNVPNSVSNFTSFQENTAMLKSEKSVGVLSDTSLRPRKGDKTPKSNASNNNLKDQEFLDLSAKKSNEKINSLKENLNDNIKRSSEGNENNNNASFGRDGTNNNNNNVPNKLSNSKDNKNNKEPNQSQLNITATNKNQMSMINKTNTSQISTDKNYNQYDVQQLSYDLVKEYSHLKINKDESFMRRMLFDVFKRQTKEERMNKLLERNKIKIDENERIKTFNRLIEDANRRLEAQEKIETMKNKLDENSIGASSKKYKYDEWEEIYEERFLKPKNEKEKKIEQKVQEKLAREKEEEEEILENVKSKKVPQHVINQMVKRMYEEAERRKLKMEEHRKKGSEEDDGVDKSQEEDLKKEREMTPSKFKKFKKVQKYNFQSDMSGNDKSASEEEKVIKAKKSLSKEKVKPSAKKQPSHTPSKSNSFVPNDRLYPKTNISTFKKNVKESNTDFNNKRFDKDKVHYNNFNNGIIREEKENLHNKLKEKQIQKANARYIIDEHLKLLDKDIFRYEEEEEARYLPKSIESISFNKEKLKVNDFKTINSKNMGTSSQSHSNQLYMPDLVASKLVDDILQGKLNN